MKLLSQSLFYSLFVVILAINTLKSNGLNRNRYQRIVNSTTHSHYPQEYDELSRSFPEGSEENLFRDGRCKYQNQRMYQNCLIILHSFQFCIFIVFSTNCIWIVASTIVVSHREISQRWMLGCNESIWSLLHADWMQSFRWNWINFVR